jgi:hypothetical protein
MHRKKNFIGPTLLERVREDDASFYRERPWRKRKIPESLPLEDAPRHLEKALITDMDASLRDLALIVVNLRELTGTIAANVVRCVAEELGGRGFSQALPTQNVALSRAEMVRFLRPDALDLAGFALGRADVQACPTIKDED